MHIEYRVNESDFISASKLAQRKRSSWSALDHYFPHIFCVLWLAGSVIPSPLNNYLKDDIDLLLTLGVFPIFLGLLVLRRGSMKKEYIKQKALHLHQALDLDATGLRLVTTAGTNRSAWDIYSKFVEDKDSFVLFQKADHEILPIPKHHLSPGQIDELHNLLEARLPSLARYCSVHAPSHRFTRSARRVGAIFSCDHRERHREAQYASRSDRRPRRGPSGRTPLLLSPGSNIEQHRNVVRHAARQHKHMPQRVEITQPVVREKDDPQRVCQAARRDPHHPMP